MKFFSSILKDSGFFSYSASWRTAQISNGVI